MGPRRNRYYTYIRPVLRNKFVKTYSSVIFSLVTIFIFSFYAIRPTVTTILSLQKSIQEQNGVLNSLKEKAANLVEGKNNYEKISPTTRDKIEYLIPNDLRLSTVINSLSTATQTSEATISGIQIQTVALQPLEGKPSKASQISEIDFSFNAQGEFENMMKLLN